MQTSEKLYAKLKGKDSPIKLSLSEQRNTTKRMVDLIFNEGVRAGKALARSEAKSQGEAAVPTPKPKAAVTGDTRPCKKCGGPLAVSSKRAIHRDGKCPSPATNAQAPAASPQDVPASP